MVYTEVLITLKSDCCQTLFLLSVKSQNQHPVKWVNPSDQLNHHESNDAEFDNKQYIAITNSTSNDVTIENIDCHTILFGI
jgi:hypothetical protein